jgi:hypothetical protein
MRKEQRERFEELGWPLPDSAATKTLTKTPTKTLKKWIPATDDDEEAETPTKKPRARKPKKETVKKEVEHEDVADSIEAEDAGVKEELLEEDI